MCVCVCVRACVCFVFFNKKECVHIMFGGMAAFFIFFTV